MKSSKNLSRIVALFILCISTLSLSAQKTKADIFNDSTEITWLGIDFTQLKMIGAASNFGDAAEINSEQLRTKYFPGWNQLFVTEVKKYDVAGAVHRPNVTYATDVTEKPNSEAKKEFFTEKAEEYALLDEKKVADLVKKYDFKGKTGIGLMFFIEGISKEKKESSGWVTFVDMKTKTVLITVRETGKPAGFGFRNYWAASFLNILKAAKSDYKDWSK